MAHKRNILAYTAYTLSLRCVILVFGLVYMPAGSWLVHSYNLEPYRVMGQLLKAYIGS